MSVLLTYFCAVDDVRARNKDRDYNDTDPPTIDDVRSFIRGYAAEIESVLDQAGYVTPITTIGVVTTSGVTSGLNALVPVPPTDQFQVGMTVRLMGVWSNRVWDEFTEIRRVDSSTALRANVKYTYNEPVTVVRVSSALEYLRTANAHAAAAQAERTVFMAANQGESTHSQLLHNEYLRLIKQIAATPGFLVGLPTVPGVDAAIPKGFGLSSFGAKNPDEIEPRFFINKSY